MPAGAGCIGSRMLADFRHRLSWNDQRIFHRSLIQSRFRRSTKVDPTSNDLRFPRRLDPLFLSPPPQTSGLKIENLGRRGDGPAPRCGDLPTPLERSRHRPLIVARRRPRKDRQGVRRCLTRPVSPTRAMYWGEQVQRIVGNSGWHAPLVAGDIAEHRDSGSSRRTQMSPRDILYSRRPWATERENVANKTIASVATSTDANRGIRQQRHS